MKNLTPKNMKRFQTAEKFFLTLCATSLAAILLGGTVFRVRADEPQAITNASTNTLPSVAGSAPVKPDVRKTLSGAELYSIHCNRCHAERFPTERTAAQWKTIMLHMQVRASIPGNQARLILQYLQENSGR